MMLLAEASLFRTHSSYNHFSLLAECWLRGKLALLGAPPRYAGMNDFAFHQGRWYVVFPPFPALLMLPFVWLAGSADRVADAVVWLSLTGVAPAVLFLTLERVRRDEGIGSERTNLGFAALLAFGTPYFFSAVQGTVWFAAHVVGMALGAVYCYAAIRAQRPWMAGIALGLAWLTRAPMLLAAPLFFFEAYRFARSGSPERGNQRCRRGRERIQWSVFLRRVVPFVLPVIAAGIFSLIYNWERFGDPFESGYRFLVVRWQGRIEQWGLFSYHYLARNLGVVLTSLPWIGGEQSAPFRINGHGLALWFTTPVLFWLGCRSQLPELSRSLGVTALCVAVPTLFYQNTGWVQFGYRFANDYSFLLIVMLALAYQRLSWVFLAAATWSIAANTFGAISFGRAQWQEYYTIDATQQILYQPD